jgi:tRNA G26 N,N-dimethylase Trm1
MNHNEINKRIAIACKVIPRYFCHHCWHVVVGKYVTFDERHDERTGGCGGRLEILSPPNYHGDLNAMHEAERVLTIEQQERYAAQLGRSYEGSFHHVTSTSAKRACAFLRTIGQWEEDK